MGTSSGIPGRCSQATEHSSGKWDISLGKLTQLRPLGPQISLGIRFLAEIPWIHVDLWLGSRKGSSRLGVEVERGCVWGRREAPSSLVCICTGWCGGTTWLGEAATEQGARLRQTVSLPQRRLVIGTLKQFSVVFVNKVSLFSTRGMKMRFWGLRRAVSFGHFICLGASAEVRGSYLQCPKPRWQVIPPASEQDDVIIIGYC